ncbi:MAG: DUF1015 family protein [Syntrophales bacterium]|jgi:uncharacterized protein (DUF1015 family)|nr:DUF1015 family protein [Syntrophales bacterium]MCK9391258.1 DUF1015 family protein [Syntrophales bacterium]
MARITPFRALRPYRQHAQAVAAPPYDVVNVEEARALAGDNPLSFLHVEKSELDLPESPHVEEQVIFQTAKKNLLKLRDEKILFQDPGPCFYIYSQQMGGHRQYGIVTGASVREYETGLIKKHEHTRADKELERINHVDTVNAQTGPVFITYRKSKLIDDIVAGIIRSPSEYAFVASDGVTHEAWVVSDGDTIGQLTAAFAKVQTLYIADGHHRAAAAASVARMRREKDPDPSEAKDYETFLAVLFPHDQLRIMDYNRVVKDLNGLQPRDFLTRISQDFEITEGFADRSPKRMHDFGMYLEGKWRRLTFKGELAAKDPVRSLDVSILQEYLLGPLLDIADPRTDKRIDFIGGIRGMEELERLVDSGRFTVAFSLCPTTLPELMDVANAGLVMPPKSTWFEPKLRSGLFVHLI